MIVGLGLPKTGTQSLQRALEILGVPHKVGDHVHLLPSYPEGKYILTVRTDADTWYDSVLRWNERKNGFSHAPKMRKQRVAMYGSEQPKPWWKHRYQAHNRALRRLPNCLEVCWERGDGWAELCGFLGCEVPNEEFPWINKNK